jgi:hypothetical protein
VVARNGNPTLGRFVSLARANTAARLAGALAHNRQLSVGPPPGVAEDVPSIVETAATLPEDQLVRLAER